MRRKLFPLPLIHLDACLTLCSLVSTPDTIVYTQLSLCSPQTLFRADGNSLHHSLL